MSHAKRCCGFLCIGLLLIQTGANSQLREQKKKAQEALSVPDLSILRGDIGKETPEVGKTLVPMDSPVDPTEYVVGPNDLIGINIWSSSPVTHNLTVTPEGDLLIPDIGSVSVLNLTLERVKSRIVDQVHKKYISSGVSVNLLTPRKVRVQIEGNVLFEQQYEVYATQRVDNLIETANRPPVGTPTPEDYEKDVSLVHRTASSRRILLRRRTGTVTNVDLVKYDITRDGRYNPYLQEGDILYVPWKSQMGGEIGIYGGAIRSTSFEFVPGDSLLDLLRMGYGLKPTADSAHIRFSRLSPDGLQMETSQFSAVALMKGEAPNLALRRGDRIFIPELVDPRENYRVRVEGEVLQPGVYPITKYGTRLSSVVKAAGGFREDANIGGSVVYRTVLLPGQDPDDAEKERLFGPRSGNFPGDSLYYLSETELRLGGELVSVDFRKLFVEGDSTQDVVLQPLDRIVVPKLKGTVYVFGQVVSPGHIPFKEGEDYLYYVDKAGGFSEDARDGDVKIVKGTTRAWLFPDQTVIGDGDYVWVPRDPYRPLSYYITPYAQLASIVAVVLTAVVVVNSLK